MKSKIIKSHRCKQVLEHNKNYELGDNVSIYYGRRFNSDITKPKWWLQHLTVDWDWDSEYMEAITVIDFCPFCGERLKNESETESKEI